MMAKTNWTHVGRNAFLVRRRDGETAKELVVSKLDGTPVMIYKPSSDGISYWPDAVIMAAKRAAEKLGCCKGLATAGDVLIAEQNGTYVVVYYPYLYASQIYTEV